MTDVAQLNITIVQGATFDKTINWYGGGKVCKEIEAVSEGCPTLVTITNHGLPSVSDTPVFVDHVKGAKSLNSKGKAVTATYVDANTFYVDADTVDETWTSGTGLVTWYAAKDLTGWSARMHIREDIDDVASIVELVSPTDITISTNDAGIRIVITATATAAFDFDNAVYDLELEDPSGFVVRLVEGDVTFKKEVTR